MANQIRLKRGTGSDPSASDLVTGELALRTDNGALFTKKDDGSVREIGPATGATDLVNDTTPQLGGDLDTNDHNINIDDDHAINFGNDNDLIVKHTGANGSINNYTGDLVIRTLGTNADDIFIDSKDDINIRVHDTDDAIKCIGDGAVELYHNNSKKFETTSTGVALGDDDKISFGTGSDNNLEIFHESSSNTNEIIAADGDIHIQCDNFQLISDDSGGRAIFLNNSGGHLELGFDGNHDARFAGNQVTFLTNVDCNSGLDVTGDITASAQVTANSSSSEAGFISRGDGNETFKKS